MKVNLLPFQAHYHQNMTRLSIMGGNRWSCPQGYHSHRSAPRLFLWVIAARLPFVHMLGSHALL